MIDVFDLIEISNLVDVFYLVELSDLIDVFDLVEISDLVDVFDLVEISDLIEVFDLIDVSDLVEVFDSLITIRSRYSLSLRHDVNHGCIFEYAVMSFDDDRGRGNKRSGVMIKNKINTDDGLCT